MTRVVLSIGSNLGDRVAHLQSVLDALGDRVRAVSPVYQTAPWGGVEQGAFLNAVVIAEDPELDGPSWLELAHRAERTADRVRDLKWGPRTLDVDLVSVSDGATEVVSRSEELTLPHPLAHLRAFVLVPWLAADPGAALTVAGRVRAVTQLLDDIDPAERAGVQPIDAVLHGPDAQA